MKVKEAKSYNCPNCGAKISHSYNHNCEYCGGILDFNEPDAIEVKAEDLVKVELREVYNDFKTNKLILIFDGYKCPMPKVFNYDGKDTYVSKVEEYVNPPKCGFCIEVDKNELKEYGIGYLEFLLHNSGLRYNEFDEVMEQVVNNKEIKFICMR